MEYWHYIGTLFLILQHKKLGKQTNLFSEIFIIISNYLCVKNKIAESMFRHTK